MNIFKNLIISLRIPHWIKNTFIFAALIFSRHLFEVSYIFKTCLAFLLFSLISSAGYLINDVIDIPEDRKHPVKNKRPIASGKLPVKTAILAAVLLIAIALPAGLLLNKMFGIVLVLYLIFELIYCFFIKHIVILDVFGIMGGFILRILAGGLVIQVEISHWLFLCAGLISLFLGFSKRRHELIILGESARQHRRVLQEYSPYFLDQMIAVVTSSTLIAYILYTISPDTIAKFGTNKLILTIPFVLYGIFRYLYLVHKKEKGGSPAELLLTDVPLLVNTALWAVVSVAIIYHT